MKRLWLVLFLSLTAMKLSADTLYIAAASNLVYCIEGLNRQFQQQYPQLNIKLTTGSSGNLFAQIQHDAPYELFLSADTFYPQQLVNKQLADANTLKVYALGQIALWTNKSELDIKKGLELLKTTAIKRIVIANPDTAPYGMAAKLALQHKNVWNDVQKKLVFAENIAQTMQFVQTQNADIAVVAVSLLSTPHIQNKGNYWLIPQSYYSPMAQAMVVTKRGQRNQWAYRYARFLQSASAQQILQQHGFVRP